MGRRFKKHRRKGRILRTRRSHPDEIAECKRLTGTDWILSAEDMIDAWCSGLYTPEELGDYSFVEPGIVLVNNIAFDEFDEDFNQFPAEGLWFEIVPEAKPRERDAHQVDEPDEPDDMMPY